MERLKIIKIGGNIIEDSQSLNDFLSGFTKIEGPKILIHGGGKLATKLAEQMGVEVKMFEGRRITDQETLDIITMVYAGKINKNIVVNLQSKSCNAIGFTGADGNTVISEKRPVKEIDFGLVGDVKNVNAEVLEVLLKNNITPVFCAITHDGNGQLLNTNADTIAADLAIAFSKLYKTELYYCFEKNGVMRDVNDENSVIKYIDSDSYLKLIEDGIIADGMLPKMKNCFYALDNDVETVCIGKTSMLFEESSNYTTIVR